MVQNRNHLVLLLGMKALSQGESFRNVEIEFIRRDGEKRIIGLTITPRMKDGELTRVMGVIRDITEEKRSKETIAIERERYKEVVENIEEGLFKIDMRGRVNFINPKVAERLTGFEIGEIEGKLLTTLAPKQEMVKLGPGLQSLVRGETIRNLDTNILKKDGSTLPSFMSLTPIVRNGKVREIFGVLNDVSDVKNAEEALKAEQEKYRTVVENMGEGLFITGTDGKILYVNPEAERISGYRAEDIVGRPFTNILTRDVQKTVLPGISKILKGESIRNMESRFMRKDGTPIIISLTLSPSIKDRKITEIMGVMRDITEQKKAEDQLLTHRSRLQERTSQLEMANQMLSQSEDRYKMLIENANDCIFHLDKSLRIVDINKRAIEMYGAKKEDIIGKNAFTLGLMPKKGDVQEYMKLLKEIIEGKLDNVDGIEAVIKNKRGEEVFLEANNSIARVKGEVTGMLVIARDVTDRKLMGEELKAKYDELIKREEELQALNEEMEAQNEELGSNYQKLLNMSEQLKMQQDVQKAFAGVISILNSTINLDVLLNRSLSSIAQFLSCQIGAIYLYDEKRGVLTPYATHGICKEFEDNEYKLGEGTV
ncbi:MAG: PAS domain S-box protein, partial [Halobacteriota archaeon]|nr:PAS domain S-box protein [Halobacteriota archaeon]